MNIRDETLVLHALIEFVDSIDAFGGGWVVEENLLRTNADDRAILFKERVNLLTLVKAEGVCREPEIG